MVFRPDVLPKNIKYDWGSQTSHMIGILNFTAEIFSFIISQQPINRFSKTTEH